MASNLNMLVEAAETAPMSQQSGEPSKQEGDESTAGSVSSASTRGESPSIGPIKPAFPSHKLKKHVLAPQVKINASKISADALKKKFKNANENIESVTNSYTDLHDRATASLEKAKRVHDSTFNNYKASVTKCNKQIVICDRAKKDLSDRNDRVDTLKTGSKNLKEKVKDKQKECDALLKKHQKYVDQSTKLREADAKALKGLEDKLQNAKNEIIQLTESKKTAYTEVEGLKKNQKILQTNLDSKEKAMNQMLTTQHRVDSKLGGKQEERDQKDRNRDKKHARLGCMLRGGQVSP
jgi:chromosome segregation ATPase